MKRCAPSFPRDFACTHSFVNGYFFTYLAPTTLRASSYANSFDAISDSFTTIIGSDKVVFGAVGFAAGICALRAAMSCSSFNAESSAGFTLTGRILVNFASAISLSISDILSFNTGVCFRLRLIRVVVVGKIDFMGSWCRNKPVRRIL